MTHARARFAPPALVVLVAVGLAAFLVAQAPHTVHHVFESDTVNDHECAFSNAAERGPATAVEVVELTAARDVVGAAPVLNPEQYVRRTLSPSSARAPPVRFS